MEEIKIVISKIINNVESNQKQIIRFDEKDIKEENNNILFFGINKLNQRLTNFK